MSSDRFSPIAAARPRVHRGPRGRTVFVLLVVGLAYALCGRLAFLLALPPGNATAFWPAAGVGFVAVTLLGYRAAPAIALGHLLLLASLIERFSSGGFQALVLVGLCSALAQGLQAAAGGHLVRRFIGWRNVLVDDGRTVFKLFGCAVLAATVAPTIGSLSVAFYGTNPWSGYPYPWGSWFVSELFGILIVAPILFAFFARPRAMWSRRSVSLGLPMLATVTASIVVFAAASRSESERRRVDFEREAQVVCEAVHRSVNDYVHLVQSIERLFAASREIERSEFETFVSGSLERHRGLTALAWAPVLRRDERDARVSLRYVVVAEGDGHELLELDLTSEQGRRGALERARDFGVPILSSRFSLAIDGADALLLFGPVFAGGFVPETLEERRERITGYAIAAFRPNEAIPAIVQDIWPQGHVLMLREPTDDAPLVHHPPNAERMKAPPFAFEAGLDVAGTHWTAAFEPTHEYVAARGTWQPWLTFTGGLLFSSLSMGFLLVITGRTSKIERIVNQRTGALLRSNEALRSESEQRRQAELALREQEAVFRAMVEDVRDYAILMLDVEGRVATWNLGAEKSYGYAPGEVVGQNVSIFYSKDDMKAGVPETSLEAARTIGHHEEEGWRMRKDGSPYWATTVLTAIRDANGELKGFSSVTRDITERRRVEADLRRRTMEVELVNALLRDTKYALEESVSELERSNQELDDFAYIASHDLKEPLRGIHNYANFLLEDYGDSLDEDGRSKLETLGRLAQRMEDLINSLLYFSRVGRLDLALEETNLDEVLRDVLDSLHITLTERGIDVRVPRPLPSIMCDRVRVGEVFRNLMTNAMKYNDKDERWIEIGFGEVRATDDGEVVEGFYVRDNGIGIREKHQASVFRIFKRLHGKDKFGGGTGAGLTIVKKIIERHGGWIRLESVYGQGTTFFFTLQKETARDGAESEEATVDTHR